LKTRIYKNQLKTTAGKKPPMRISEEAEKNHLELAKKQGVALKAALNVEIKTEKPQ
jgi:hypothetical protein